LDDGAKVGHLPVHPTWLEVVSLAAPLNALGRAALDPGEAAVIQLALEQGIGVVCLDDRKGRRAALAAGLRVTGSLGLLVRAKALGLVPTIRPIVERAAREGIWYDAELVRQILASVGE
jgi:predicted nucleic acid-binding protein